MLRMRSLLRFTVACGVLLLTVCPAVWCADTLSAPEFIALAKTQNPDLRAGIESTFDAKQLKAGTAWVGRGSEFFFALEADAAPSLVIDEAAGPLMEALPGEGSGSRIWYAVAHIEPVGKLHQYHYIVNGVQFGGSLDVPAFGPLSYFEPGVPTGTLSEKITHTSKIYDGMKSDYWIYVPSEYDPKTPAALMVFQDGEGYLDRNGKNPALNVIDNLIAEKKIPVVICVFINPGDIADSPGTPTYDFVKGYSEKWRRTLQDSMRSTLYDTVSDRYARFLRDEILPDVAAKYNLRTDAYSHAITGGSSGGICSFNAAWQMPDLFSRVISWIGSFTSIQWKEDPANPDGGQDYPEKGLRETHRNLRVWLEDGANDEEIDHFGFRSYGSWPLGNIQMANSLKGMQYDFHLSFGKGTHNSGGGAAEFPAEMIWLWRDYDAAKTEQEFTMDPAEKSKPYFRVAALNRAAD